MVDLLVTFHDTFWFTTKDVYQQFLRGNYQGSARESVSGISEGSERGELPSVVARGGRRSVPRDARDADALARLDGHW